MPQARLDTRDAKAETKPKARQALQLPNLVDTACYYFQACGVIREDQDKETELLARYGTKQKIPMYIRFIRGGKQIPMHFHVDIVRGDHYKRHNVKLPQATAKLAEIRRTIIAYYGQEAFMCATAWFYVPIERVTSALIFTGTHAVDTKIGDVAVEVVGARLAFSGPTLLREIEWDVSGQELHVRVMMIYDDLTIEYDYLSKLFAQTEHALNKYVLGSADASQ